MRRVVVLIGGTGVIGSSVAAVAHAGGMDVVSLSLDPNRTSPNYTNIQIDLGRSSPAEMQAVLVNAVGDRPVALILDSLGLADEMASVVASFADARSVPFGLISSCLVYDHDGACPVDEDFPLVAIGPGMHAYLRDKLAIESFWRGQPQVAWRIFRCNHILGAGSLLGCIPNHNRDPRLLSRLQSGTPLALARGGEIMLSWVHPEDLANMILSVCDDPGTSHLIINANAPEPVNARQYYEEIARCLGIAVPMIHRCEPDPRDFWSLTARNNVFVSRHALYRQLTFRHDLASAIRDALSVPETEQAFRGRFLLARVKERGGR